MLTANFDTNKIYNEVKAFVKNAGVSLNIHNSRPPLNDTPPNEMVVISVVSRMSDLMAYGRCLCAIDLYSKNLSDGTMNGVKLSIMNHRLRSVLPFTSENYVFSDDITIIPLGNDGYGYHVERLQFNILIKSI
jgi:hypothetical protein